MDSNHKHGQDRSTVSHNQGRRRQRAKSRSEPWKRNRASCRAPRLDNQQLMELHQPNASQQHHRISFGHLHQRQQRNEFLDQWMEQLEETTRQMPYESLLQRVLQLESELMDTQEKLKKANKHLSTSRDGSKQSSAPSSPLYCASPHANYGSPIYQSPRLVSPSAE